MSRDLRERVCLANQRLGASSLVMGTFGNASEVDRAAGLMAIKPSGVGYAELTPESIVLVSLASGEVVDGTLRPSSDTPTHLVLYRAFESCGGIVHTHSEYATSFAQARAPICCMGTTHADYFRGDVPVTRPLRQDEVDRDYEKNTGLVIVEAFAGRNPSDIPAVLVANHGPFTWGASAMAAVDHADVLEYVARLNWRAYTLAADAPRPEPCLVEKHHSRKHGPGAYYGQR